MKHFPISLYKEARIKIIEVKCSGNMWWVDEVQEILNSINDEGIKLNNKIECLLNKLDGISPILKLNCENFVKYESEKSFVLGQYLILSDIRAKRDFGYTFEEKFNKIIDDMEKSICNIKNQMNILLKEYEFEIKH